GPGLPLAGVGENGPGALGHATEVDLRDRQHAVPHEADVELAPADVLLDEYFVELLRHGREARAQRLAVAHDGAAVESRARVLRRRLDDGRQGEVVLDLSLRHRPAGNGEPRLLEQRVRYGLAAARGEGPEARARDGDPREFERSHDMLFPPAAGPVPRGGSPRRPSAPVPSAGARRYGPLPGSARRSRTRPRAPPWGSRSSWPDREGRPAGGSTRGRSARRTGPPEGRPDTSRGIRARGRPRARCARSRGTAPPARVPGIGRSRAALRVGPTPTSPRSRTPAARPRAGPRNRIRSPGGSRPPGRCRGSRR